jgi:hypothetical protein
MEITLAGAALGAKAEAVAMHKKETAVESFMVDGFNKMLINNGRDNRYRKVEIHVFLIRTSVCALR